MQPSRLIRIPRLVAASFSSSSHRLLEVGDVLRQSRRFTDADVDGYSVVSGDQNPIHLDAAFSRQIAGFDRGRIVHGLLVTSLFPSLIASQFVQELGSIKWLSPLPLETEVKGSILTPSRPEVYFLEAASLPMVGPGAVYASQNLQFKLPVYIGDEVVAEVRGTNIRAFKEKYYVKWTTKCYMDNECLVLDGEATTVLREITPSK